MRRILRATSIGCVMVLGLGLVAAVPAGAGETRPPIPLRTFVAYQGPGGEGRFGVEARPSGRPAVVIAPGRPSTVVLDASADGTVVLYATADGSSANPFGVVRVVKDGREVFRGPGTGSTPRIAFPTLSDDGRSLIYSQGRHLRLVNVTTGASRPLCPACAFPERSWAMSLSPDRAWIAVSAMGEEGDWELLIVRRVDGEVVARTIGMKRGIDPTIAWRPDSREVAFVVGDESGPDYRDRLMTATVGGVVRRSAISVEVPGSLSILRAPAYTDSGVIVESWVISSGNPQILTSRTLVSESWRGVARVLPGSRVRRPLVSADEVLIAAPSPWVTAVPRPARFAR